MSLLLTMYHVNVTSVFRQRDENDDEDDKNIFELPLMRQKLKQKSR